MKKKKARQEEIHLDEALEDGKTGADSDALEEEPEEVHPGKPESGETGVDREGERSDGAVSRKGMVGCFLRKKWLWVGFVGVLAGFFGLTFGYGMLGNLNGNTRKLFSFIGEGRKKAAAPGYTPLRPFFVPLPKGSENIAIRLDMSVRWAPESRARYLKQLTSVRNNVFQFLLKAVQSEKDFGKKESHLESELSVVFQHALAVTKVEVRLDKITPI